MTLRYKLVRIPTESGAPSPEDIKFWMDTVKGLRKRTIGMSIKMRGGNSEIGDVFNLIRNTVRSNRNALQDNINRKVSRQYLQIQSEKEWKIFNEYTSDGNTMYGNSDGSDYINEEFEYKGVKATRSRFNGKPEMYKINDKVPYAEPQFDDDGVEIPLDPKAKGAMLAKLKNAREAALATLKDYRKVSKTVNFVEKSYKPKLPDGGSLPFEMKYKVYTANYAGGSSHSVHFEKGDIMRLKDAAKLRDVFVEKKPKTDANHVGIEIEFVSKGDKEVVATALAKRNLQSFVCLKTDGSLRKDKEYQYTHELCIIAEETVVHEVLKGVIEALDEVGCAVNKTCGLHVHLDMRNRDKKIAFYNLVKSQNILYSMNPASRLTGEDSKGAIADTIYSRRVETTDFEAAMAPGTGRDARYQGINPMSFKKHSTIEVRIHSGSTSFNKISNWVRILVAIVNSSTKNATDYVKPEAFCEKYDLDVNVLSYINERIAKFKNKDGKHVTMDEAS